MASAVLATASNTFIIGPIAKFFGLIMNAIFKMGVHNVGLCIIIFTIIVYMLQLPLTIKQQKFSRMSMIMNPELQAVQRKYKNKNDQVSMQKMQLETREIYDKYGVSMSGGCLPLLIQLPILYGFYRVIQNVPAYVPAIKAMYNKFGLVDAVKTGISSKAFIKFAKGVGVSVDNVTKNKIIDTLYKLTDSTWADLKSLGKGIKGFSTMADKTYAAVKPYMLFLGINIAESPLNLLKANWAAKSYGMVIVAILIPVLSGVTQFINLKLMPTATQKGNTEESNMANSMKSMNAMMPLISVFFCFTLPVGLGIYWIMGAVIRTIQQIFINRHFDKLDPKEIIEKNKEKAAKKKAKRRVVVNENLQERAKTNTRNIRRSSTSKIDSPPNHGTPKAGSLASKANMVRKFDEKNKK